MVNNVCNVCVCNVTMYVTMSTCLICPGMAHLAPVSSATRPLEIIVWSPWCTANRIQHLPKPTCMYRNGIEVIEGIEVNPGHCADPDPGQWPWRGQGTFWPCHLTFFWPQLVQQSSFLLDIPFQFAVIYFLRIWLRAVPTSYDNSV